MPESETPKIKHPILVVEDDPNDVFFIKRALKKNHDTTPVYVVANGKEAIAYLRGEGMFEDRAKFPVPMCIITDLKMPVLSGLELLDWLANHPKCAVIPTIVFSSSNQLQDVRAAYSTGANAYFKKPHDFEEWTRLFRLLIEFWEVAEKPEPTGC